MSEQTFAFPELDEAVNAFFEAEKKYGRKPEVIDTKVDTSGSAAWSKTVLVVSESMLFTFCQLWSPRMKKFIGGVHQNFVTRTDAQTFLDYLNKVGQA